MIHNNPSVLVVDDDPCLPFELAAGLMRAEWPVVIATNVKHALDCLSLHPFDLVFIEIILPDRDGIEAIHEIRRRRPECQIVAMSGGGFYLSADQTLRLARAVGADAVLAKPFCDSKALALGRDLLRQRCDPAREAERAETIARLEHPFTKAARLRNLSDEELDAWIADKSRTFSSGKG